MTRLQNWYSKHPVRGPAIIASLIAAVLSLGLTLHVASLVSGSLVAQQRQSVLGQLSQMKARLEGRLLEAVALGEGFRSYISRHPELSQEDFEFLGANLVEDNPNIRSLGVAPDNVIRFVYPANEVNSRAIGLDYRKVEAQWPDIERAMTQRSTVVSGPINLVQGGRGLLVRIPIYTPHEGRREIGQWPYWGVATLVLDIERILKSADLINLPSGLEIELARDASGGISAENAHIAGTVLDAAEGLVTLSIDVPGGSGWILKARTQGGWKTTGAAVFWVGGIGLLLSGLIAGLVFLVIYELQKVRSLALNDPLTGLPNRRQIESRMQGLVEGSRKSSQAFDIFFVDLDGFKAVNDTHGHEVGDELLMEVGQRLRRLTRNDDMVARIGGDEFIVLVVGSLKAADREAFRKRIEGALHDRVDLSSVELDMKASVGTASYPEDARTIIELRRTADARMYHEKSRKRSSSTNARTPLAALETKEQRKINA